ncbi:MAG: 6-phosphofructokinase [Cyclobacteriaceae bacterium]|nr:6-phosphofructokinase [Cyclobacteriaceae bacterium]
MSHHKDKASIGVLTSGGDSPGMNASVRAVVRSGLYFGYDVYAIMQGYRGMVNGGDMIVKMEWDDVSGILHKGGTKIGTARCKEFREREGRLVAAYNLIKNNISKLVIIGGDGSLTGANIFKDEWPDLIKELLNRGRISEEELQLHNRLDIVGLVGSIDNDMSGTDMTIGADTALKRITDAIDIISSTAASHQRTFIVEVMGRNCGYLALMSALATGADYVFIPELPPQSEQWEDEMVNALRLRRQAGKKESMVILAEGARDKNGQSISSEKIQNIIHEKMGEDARITILGHIQRGGAPTAYDRYMSTVQGFAAVEYLHKNGNEKESKVIGMQKNEVVAVSLMDSVEKTRSIEHLINEKKYDEAIALRGGSFKNYYDIYKLLSKPKANASEKAEKSLNLLVLNCSGPAPGMNATVKAAVRTALDAGHTMFGVYGSFEGLATGKVKELEWMEVEDWISMGGCELGTNKKEVDPKDYYLIARNLEKLKIDGLMVIGGYTGYEIVHTFYKRRHEFPAFDIPMVCVPACIDNNLPFTDYSIGSDTALNNIVEAIDKIKDSAIASNRVFVVEVMGRYCGYLALISGLSTGAERVYMHENGITLKDLQKDVDMLIEAFKNGKRLGLLIKSERANDLYNTQFLCSLFEEEGGHLFDVRQSILGHLQQGGNPSPVDRLLATRLGSKATRWLLNQVAQKNTDACMSGIRGGEVDFKDIDYLPKMMNQKFRRPKDEWWLKLQGIAEVFAKSSADAL